MPLINQLTALSFRGQIFFTVFIYRSKPQSFMQKKPTVFGGSFPESFWNVFELTLKTLSFMGEGGGGFFFCLFSQLRNR